VDRWAHPWRQLISRLHTHAPAYGLRGLAGQSADCARKQVRNTICVVHNSTKSTRKTHLGRRSGTQKGLDCVPALANGVGQIRATTPPLRPHDSSSILRPFIAILGAYAHVSGMCVSASRKRPYWRQSSHTPHGAEHPWRLSQQARSQPLRVVSGKELEHLLRQLRTVREHVTWRTNPHFMCVLNSRVFAPLPPPGGEEGWGGGGGARPLPNPPKDNCKFVCNRPHTIALHRLPRTMRNKHTPMSLLPMSNPVKSMSNEKVDMWGGVTRHAVSTKCTICRHFWKRLVNTPPAE
jgi:hypothetical protein